VALSETRKSTFFFLFQVLTLIGTPHSPVLPVTDMPELLEQQASYEGIKHALLPLLPEHDFHVRAIWADATQTEAEAQWPSDHPVRAGLVYKVELHDPHRVLRGGSPKAHTDIYPNSLLEHLELKGVHNSSRALLIDFGKAWLRVRHPTLFTSRINTTYEQRRCNISRTQVSSSIVELCGRILFANSTKRYAQLKSYHHVFSLYFVLPLAEL
jgi:hypothetical protein